MFEAFELILGLLMTVFSSSPFVVADNSITMPSPKVDGIVITMPEVKSKDGAVKMPEIRLPEKPDLDKDRSGDLV